MRWSSSTSGAVPSSAYDFTYDAGSLPRPGPSTPAHWRMATTSRLSTPPHWSIQPATSSTATTMAFPEMNLPSHSFTSAAMPITMDKSASPIWSPVAKHYGMMGGVSWADGDFNGDNSVNFADLVLVAQHYGTRLSKTPVSASLPTVILSTAAAENVSSAQVITSAPAGDSNTAGCHTSCRTRYSVRNSQADTKTIRFLNDLSSHGATTVDCFVPDCAVAQALCLAVYPSHGNGAMLTFTSGNPGRKYCDGVWRSFVARTTGFGAIALPELFATARGGWCDPVARLNRSL